MSTDQSETAAAGQARYRIRHATRCGYGDDIVLAHHVLHLAPRQVPNQRILGFRMVIAPEPSVLAPHIDLFGNPTTYLELREPHESLEILTELEVEIDPPVAPESLSPVPWETLRDALMDPADRPARGAATFAYPSGLVPAMAELKDYALPSFGPGRAVADAALDLTRRIHADFTFDPSATTISTPLAEVLAERRGVCQDFAHLALGCVRSLGLAGRYVSGYLRTIPPPGRKRLVGADVSHAWLSVWCGGDAWLDLDPTNGCSGSTDMISLAWGRDYYDVSPMRGVILGSRRQNLSVEVDVE